VTGHGVWLRDENEEILEPAEPVDVPEPTVDVERMRAAAAANRLYEEEAVLYQNYRTELDRRTQQARAADLARVAEQQAAEQAARRTHSPNFPRSWGRQPGQEIPRGQPTKPRSSESVEYDAFWELTLNEALAIRELVGQPETPWGLNECLGKDAVVPKMDYQTKAPGLTSTPREAFGIMDEGFRHADLTLWTPWTKLGEGVEELSRRDSGWVYMVRGECCGLQAMLSLRNMDGQMRAKVKCLGAEKGWRCRRSGPPVSVFSVLDETCIAGLKCEDTATSFIDGFGECQPA